MYNHRKAEVDEEGLMHPTSLLLHGRLHGVHGWKGRLPTRFSMEHWNSLIFFKVSLSRFTSLMYMAKS